MKYDIVVNKIKMCTHVSNYNNNNNTIIIIYRSDNNNNNNNNNNNALTKYITTKIIIFSWGCFWRLRGF